MSQSTENKISSFRKISFLTVIAVYFLILVGGIVRSTGSGMGCPDWPKCFGSVVPPTSVDQLPENYQEIYLQKRIAKNNRFVATLEKLGFDEMADAIANDKSILIEEEFNPVKTWIEYLNRLVGVIIGFFIILTVWKSFPLWKLDRWIPILAIGSLVLVLFQGWIGSLVVSTNLLHWMITFHMMLAILQVGVMIYLYHRSGRLRSKRGVSMDVPSKIEWVLILALILMLVQVVLGTQVREEIDQISFALGNMLRGQWIEKIGLPFLIHRSFSLLLLGVHVLYFFWAFKYTLRKSTINYWSQLLMVLVIVEIATGMGMAYFAIPAFLQPIHLLIGILILGVQYLLILQLREQKQFRLNAN
ncbi:COX15/CtaA family protein [Algoriphagus machipongonensis]|uniref:Cytochrome oxidase assembly protein n=1 Tax=Algoriphagus machipongonensis TaxID=388413 RepID=A3HZ90_9BACT|nr:COX15/CtaA family protein [Algoriphagus machipongonensis]EAZ80576.1 cytochrome oxidase assembly protein [Algoriphagus machipongonensis]